MCLTLIGMGGGGQGWRGDGGSGSLIDHSLFFSPHPLMRGPHGPHKTLPGALAAIIVSYFAYFLQYSI